MNRSAKRAVKAAAVVIGVFAVFAAVYAVLILRKPPVTDAVRSERAPESSFVRLEDGVTEYQIAGPEDGPPVVLVSGFSVPFFCWDPVFEALSQSGFRVIRYNHWGRGYSDHYPGRYTPDVFESQLLGLIGVLVPDTGVDLVGLSMGGAVAVMFANRHPELVGSLCLISPAGFPIPEAFTTRLVRVPVIGDFIYALVGDSVLTARNAENLFRFADFPEFQTQFEEQFDFRGINRALLSTLRHMPFSDVASEYEELGASGTPVCLVWGEEDAVIPFENHRLVLAAVGQAEFRAVPDAGHNAQYEAADAVVPVIVEFLSR